MHSFDQIKAMLSATKNELAERFRVSEIAVFGSYARNEQTPESDIDILVEFSSPVGIEFIDLGDYLEQVLDLRVDLVSRKGIKPTYFRQIESDLKYV